MESQGQNIEQIKPEIVINTLPDTKTKLQKKNQVILSIAILVFFTSIGMLVVRKVTQNVNTSPDLSEASTESPDNGGCSQDCSGAGGLLRSCDPIDGDGTSQDSLCNKAGRKEVCGGVDYCCSAPGGSWSPCAEETPTPSPTSTPVPAPVPTPPGGIGGYSDYNQSGTTDIKDFVLFAGYYQEDDLKADLSLDEVVNIVDFSDHFAPEYIEDHQVDNI